MMPELAAASYAMSRRDGARGGRLGLVTRLELEREWLDALEVPPAVAI